MLPMVLYHENVNMLIDKYVVIIKSTMQSHGKFRCKVIQCSKYCGVSIWTHHCTMVPPQYFFVRLVSVSSVVEICRQRLSTRQLELVHTSSAGELS